MPSPDYLLRTAVRAAKKAGTVIKKAFNEPKDVVFKRFADPVTETDRESERTIVGILSRATPDYSILTEETLSRKGAHPTARWIIDPLDGTVNFTHRIPFVAVSIGLEIDGAMQAGVIYNPVTDELYTAALGRGAYRNGRRINVSGVADIGKSLIATGFPYEREGRLEELIKPMRVFLTEYQAYRRLGSAAMDLVYLADGRFEGFYEESLKPWDTAAGLLIVTEAGGRVTDYYGGPYRVESRTILATNGLVHDAMLAVLKEVKSPS